MTRRKKKKNSKRPIEKEKKPSKFALPPEIKKWIIGVIMFLIAIIIALSFFNLAGAAGEGFIKVFTFLLGNVIFILPLFFILGGLVFFIRPKENIIWLVILTIAILILGTSGIFGVFDLNQSKPLSGFVWNYVGEGGWIGNILGWPLLKLFGFWTSQIIFLAVIVIGVIILFRLLHLAKPKPLVGARPLEEETKTEKKPFFLKKIFAPKFKIKEIEPVSRPQIGQASFSEKSAVPFQVSSLESKTKVKEELGQRKYLLPPLDLLERDHGAPSAGDVQANLAIIKRTLQNFDIPVEMSEVNIGSTVTQYTLKPAEGVKLSKITTLANDLSLSLAAHPIRIEAPIPGKSLVGIEVPNKVRTLVRLRNLIEHPSFQNSPSSLTLVLGRDVAGLPVFADLDRMPHLLVAGSTGTGKTCAADTLTFTEKGLLTFEELYSLPLNTEADFKIKLVSRDGIETTEKIYNNGICQFYKLSTDRGYQIEATAEHPLWVINKDGSWGWKPASVIKEGDYVAINREPVLFGSKVDLLDFKPSKIKAYHKEISFPQKMTPRLSQFLGLLTADGGLSVERKGIHRITYTQASQELLSLYKKSLKELFGITQFIEKISGSNSNNKAKEIVVNSKHLKEFLAFLGMDSIKSPQKVIPQAIREAPKEIVVAYLKALFDNDGYAGKNSIELCLSSEKLVSQVQIMLLNFGLISSLKVKKVKEYPQNKYFRLSIYGQEARKFIKEIGFIRNEKYKNLAFGKNLEGFVYSKKAKKLLKLLTNPNIDLIPHISSLLKTLGQKYLNCFADLTNKGWKYQSGILIPKYAFNSLKSYNSGERRPSYQALKRILNFYQPISQEPEYQWLDEIFKRNFYWDRVKKIDRTSGAGYDFFVPGSDSFVGNGFVNHNTICLNSIILSLLYQNQNSPENLRFILIDPKRVEFSTYSGLPHLLTPVIFDAQRTVNALKWLVGEMERRFDVLSEAKTRNIAAYNEIVRKTLNTEEEKTDSGITAQSSVMPYIVLVIDELADLMAARGREVEAGIVRLAQMARAVGIHLIVATQRPSVEVITGLIKANITSRIGFQVASQIDSRTILDMAGSEKLLGLGDMLFISAEVAKPKRIQAAYISDKEVKRVVGWIKSKVKNQESRDEEIRNGLAEDLEKSLTMPEIELRGNREEEDPLYEEAKRVVIESKKASASLLQRRLRIGYARAARLIDILEGRGVVGPGEGAKPREIYIKSEEENEGWQKV